MPQPPLLLAGFTDLLTTLRWPLTGAYLLLLTLIGTYGVHRYWLVYLFARHRREVPRPTHRFTELPRVTVQLPVFNEGRVVERIIDAACVIQYPADRLQVQVLDDSTDGSEQIARRRVDHWRERGVDIELRAPHRPHRLQGRRPGRRYGLGQR